MSKLSLSSNNLLKVDLRVNKDKQLLTGPVGALTLTTYSNLRAWPT